MKVSNKRTYATARKGEYPLLEDQLDAIWKGGTDAVAMRNIVLGVKDKYPKPEDKP